MFFRVNLKLLIWQPGTFIAKQIISVAGSIAYFPLLWTHQEINAKDETERDVLQVVRSVLALHIT